MLSTYSWFGTESANTNGQMPSQYKWTKIAHEMFILAFPFHAWGKADFR